MTNRLEQLCVERGFKMNEKRRIILDVLDQAHDHPSVDDVYKRVVTRDRNISIATVYRTINILADAGLLTRLTLGGGKSRYEETQDEHHEHLIDVRSGAVVEFRNPEIAELIRQAAAALGYRPVDYRLEVFAESEGSAQASSSGPLALAAYGSPNGGWRERRPVR